MPVSLFEADADKNLRTTAGFDACLSVLNGIKTSRKSPRTYSRPGSRPHQPCQHHPSSCQHHQQTDVSSQSRSNPSTSSGRLKLQLPSLSRINPTNLLRSYPINSHRPPPRWRASSTSPTSHSSFENRSCLRWYSRQFSSSHKTLS